MFKKPDLLSLLFLTIIALIYNCTSTDSKSADLVFKNGLIFTVDSSNCKAEALAIKDGKFIFVGEDKGVRNCIGDKTKVIDLKGRLILPSLIDSHRCRIWVRNVLTKNIR